MSPIVELMSRSVDGVFAIDGEQRIVFWNNACEQLTGIPAEDALYMHCHDVLKGHDPHGRKLCKSNCPLGKLSKGGPPPSQLPMRITHTDGQNLQLCVSTMLVPSCREDEWNVVHVMRRGRSIRMDEGYDYMKVPQGMAPQCVAHVDPDASQIGVSLLTTRERQILQLLAHGAAVNAMSDHLHISVATVRNHIQRLMAKLDVHSRVEAVAYAHRCQLI